MMESSSILETVTNYECFVSTFIYTAKKSIPRYFRKEYSWNVDSDSLYEEFKQSPDPETAKELLYCLNEAR